MYASLARQIAAIRNPQDATPALNELRKKLQDRVPSEAEFLALFPELIYTNTISKQRALVKYVLARVARAEGHAFTADMEELTIEHLHPQSKIDGGHWGDDIVGQIGNLILVPRELNDKLDNKSFSEKKRILKAHKNESLLPGYFWSSDELTPDLVVRRTQEVGTAAYRSIWKI